MKKKILLFRQSALVVMLCLSSGLAWGQSGAFITRWQAFDENVLICDPDFPSDCWTETIPAHIIIPTSNGPGYNYNVSWVNLSNPGIMEGSATGVTGDYSIWNLESGSVYSVSISGSFPHFFMNDGESNAEKLLSIEQWGNIAWTSMQESFQGCINMVYNALDTPNLTNATSMFAMFKGCTSFPGSNPNITFNNWNTQSITNMSSVFENTPQFNHPIDNWNISNVTTLHSMFKDAVSFNQPLANWNTANVTDMTYLFLNATNFNQPIATWNTSNVTNMRGMFALNNFNQPIGNWNTSNVNIMHEMFHGNSSFNQPIGNWNVANVNNTIFMFYGATAFNQAISNWNLSNVVNMNGMFFNASAFNQPIGNWNVSTAQSMQFLMNGAASFNQNLGSWNLTSISPTGLLNMLNNSGMTCENYSATLIGWANNPSTPNGRSLGALGRTYGLDAVAARNILTGTKGWTISGDIAGTVNCLSAPPQGQITNLLCSSAVNSGNLIENVAAGTVSSTVSYTGGNAGPHTGQVVTSTGVSGLTATLSGGNFGNGNGTLVYTISGTPTSSGTANFALNIGGQTCTIQMTVLANPYAPGTVFCNGTPTPVIEVTNPETGRKWMDRNLGANQVSTSITNSTSYGDLYQWGRGADGHQCRTSPVSSTLSASNQPGNNQFIASAAGVQDWRNPQNDNLWQGVNGVNNPCPAGFRIPTAAEFDAEIQTWSSNNAAGAFASPLKWSMAGLRGAANGVLYNAGQLGHYWSSTVNGTDASYLWFNNTQALTVSFKRAFGFSIRCIKDVPPPSYGVDVINTCPPFIWIDGNSYSASNNTATHTIPNGAANGGDSIVTLNLTILQCSQLTPVFCGLANAGFHSDIAAVNVLGAQSYRFRIVGNNLGNNWINNTNTIQSNDRFFRFSEINGTYWGQTYQIDVAVSMDGVNFGPYGNLCSVTLTDIPTTSIGSNTCNLGAVGGGHNISANPVFGALGYRFRIVGNNTAGWPANTLVFNSATNSFQFNSIPGLIWGQTYAISAAILSQDGVTYGAYGPVCSLTFNFPSVSLLPQFCNITGVTTNMALRANTAPDNTGYMFRIIGPTTNMTIGTALITNSNITNSDRIFTFSQVQNIMPVIAGQTYTVEVAIRAQDGVNYGPFGAVCNVTLSNVLMQGLNPNGELNTYLFEVDSSPNPFSADFGLQVSTNQIDEWIQVTIYDMSGKLIESRNVAPLDMESVRFGQNLASGMYMIEVKQGKNQALIRQVKN